MFLLVVAVSFISSGAEKHISLSEGDALKHLEEFGYLSKYVKDISFDEGLLDDLSTTDNKFLVFDDAAHFSFPKDLLYKQLNNSRTVLNYLNDFGYLDAFESLKTQREEPNTLDLISTEDLQGSLMLFQFMHSLHPSGYVDTNVLAQMRVPRCGVQDIDPQDPDSLRALDWIGSVEDVTELRRKLQNDIYRYIKTGEEGEGSEVAINKRFATSNDRWYKNKLAFYIENYSYTLGEHTLAEILRALEVWTEKVEMYLYQVKEEKIADIRIRFKSREHGDRYGFDGAMGVLGHAFYPPSGEVHFDNDEEFTRYTSRGVNLRYTASHEFGHSLGLKHSTKQGSLMSPFHPGYTENIALDEDDIEGISKLFKSGKGAVYEASTLEAQQYQAYLWEKFAVSRESKPLATNLSCIEEVDAAIRHPRSKAFYFFTRNIYYKVEKDGLGEMGVAEGYPKYIGESWDGLEDNIDAAYVDEALLAAYFIKGNKLWQYDLKKDEMYPGYPKTFQHDTQKDVDAALMVNGEKSFFSKGQIKNAMRKDNSLKDSSLVADAAFSLNVGGYFAAVDGGTYSIYNVKNMVPVPVYRNRPLSWDFSLPMCGDHLLYAQQINPKMRPFCHAYALLAQHDPNLDIPEECYSVSKRFPVIPLEQISGRDV